ncbi:hypothetical protein MLD38_025912 [Melastoma candidum]|nr:hypothetical protein MLD38_025912 [Melastoma candidum]
MTRAIPISEESVFHLPVDHASLTNGDWSDIQATESSIEDVREITQETGVDSSSMDIPVVSQPHQSSH